jgi:4-amino-4-deoxy-L-arabinose transferase-like glycosyltransferase
LALVLRVGWIAYADFVPTVGDDAGRYDLLGRTLADNAGYTNPNGTTTMFWPPGYPFVLAGIYKLWPAAALGDHEVEAALVVNALLGAATVVLVYGIGRRAFEERSAKLAALLTALFPSLVFYAGVTLSETAFTFLALLAVWLTIEAQARHEWRLLVLSGAVIGFAALVRGQALLLPLVVLPFWWRSSGSWRSALARAAGVGALAMLVVLPWTLRNYGVSGSAVLISSNAGVDFYIGHSAGADGRGQKVDDLVFRYPDRSQAAAEAQINRDGFREGIEYAMKHPLREVSLSARKLFWLYYRDDEALKWNEAHGEHRFLSHAERRALAAISNWYYWLMLALALAGAGRWFSLRDPARLLLVSLVGYWTLVHVAFFGDPRFHAPIMPVVALWAACGVGSVRDVLARRRPT